MTNERTENTPNPEKKEKNTKLSLVHGLIIAAFLGVGGTYLMNRDSSNQPPREPTPRVSTITSLTSTQSNQETRPHTPEVLSNRAITVEGSGFDSPIRFTNINETLNLNNRYDITFSVSDIPRIVNGRADGYAVIAIGNVQVQFAVENDELVGQVFSSDGRRRDFIAQLYSISFNEGDDKIKLRVNVVNNVLHHDIYEGSHNTILGATEVDFSDNQPSRVNIGFGVFGDNGVEVNFNNIVTSKVN